MNLPKDTKSNLKIFYNANKAEYKSDKKNDLSTKNIRKQTPNTYKLKKKHTEKKPKQQFHYKTPNLQNTFLVNYLEFVKLIKYKVERQIQIFYKFLKRYTNKEIDKKTEM
jgi:hypothetical protein